MPFLWPDACLWTGVVLLSSGMKLLNFLLTTGRASSLEGNIGDSGYGTRLLDTIRASRSLEHREESLLIYLKLVTGL